MKTDKEKFDDFCSGVKKGLVNLVKKSIPKSKEQREIDKLERQLQLKKRELEFEIEARQKKLSDVWKHIKKDMIENKTDWKLTEHTATRYINEDKAICIWISNGASHIKSYDRSMPRGRSLLYVEFNEHDKEDCWDVVENVLKFKDEKTIMELLG